MAGIGNIIQQGIKYTTKGSTLVRKQLGLLAQDFTKEGFKGIKIPEGAVSYDAVKVGRNFNAAENFTDIFTFRDKDGKILQRLTNQVDGKDTKQTVKWYRQLFEHDIELDEFGEELLWVDAHKISGYERINGRIGRVWNEVIAKTDEANPKVTIFKRSSDGDRETHYLAQLGKGQKPKFIENIYNLFETLPVNGEKAKGIGKFELVSSRVSDEALKEIAEHPYIFPAMSKYNKFIYRMFGAIDKDAAAILSPEIQLYKSASRKAGYYADWEGFSGTVHINKLDARGNIRSRDDLTNTIAHEYGHHQWEEKARNLEVFGDDPALKISDDELVLLKKYLRSIEDYVSPEEDMKAYYQQFSERAARVEGREAVHRLHELNKKIDKEFHFKHAEQFYDISKEGNESINDFAVLIDSFGESKKDLHNVKEINMLKSFAEMLQKKESKK